MQAVVRSVRRTIKDIEIFFIVRFSFLYCIMRAKTFDVGGIVLGF